ncbi:MAG: hypothetical protein ACI89X_004959, partial [Planctomycetota bacterium]
HSLLGLHEYEHWPSFIPADQEHDRAMEPDALIGAFSMLDDSMDEDGVELRAESGHLFMRGTAEQIQNWEDLVNIARSHFSAPIKFEAAVIRHDGKTLPPSVVDPEQAQALLNGHKHTWSSAATSPSRIAAYMGHHRAVSYLHTNQAQISEARWEGSPQQDELFDGVGVVAVAHRLSEDDDLILQTQFAIGSLVEMCLHEIGLDNQEDPQRPVLSVTAASMSGRIKNGGALVFNATAPRTLGGNVMVVVRASWTPVKQKTPDNIMILPISSLVAGVSSTPRFARTDRVDLALPSNDSGHDDEEREALIDDGRLHELISDSIDPETWEDTAMMQAMNGHMMFRAKPDTLKKVRKLMAKQERELLQTIEVVYENDKGRITLPTLAQHGHGVRHGRETTAIAGLETEIATKASIKTPLVVRVFEGIQFGISPYAANQSLGAQLNWTSRLIEGKPAGIALPPMHITARTHTGAIPAGGMATGKGPLGNESWALRLR